MSVAGVENRGARPGAAQLALMVSAFCWGCSWWPYRQLEALGLHPLWATCFVFGLASIGLTLRRRGAWRELLSQPALLAMALASGLSAAAFNWAVTIGDVVRVVLMFYLMPVWSLLLARWLLGERFGPRALPRRAAALAGVAIVLRPEGGGWPLPATPAELLGLVGGFAYALASVLMRREAARSVTARALAVMGGSTLAAAALALAFQVPLPPGFDPIWLGGVVALTLVFLLSNVAYQYGVVRLPAAVSSLVMLTEVLFASGSAMLLGAGDFSLRVAAGAALILGAGLVRSR
ncbi:MAG: DMT family transporter [Burkholderiales bacterium]|nr:DMT family transporter [Burkholderiales bacterium]